MGEWAVLASCYLGPGSDLRSSSSSRSGCWVDPSLVTDTRVNRCCCNLHTSYTVCCDQYTRNIFTFTTTGWHVFPHVTALRMDHALVQCPAPKVDTRRCVMLCYTGWPSHRQQCNKFVIFTFNIPKVRGSGKVKLPPAILVFLNVTCCEKTSFRSFISINTYNYLGGTVSPMTVLLVRHMRSLDIFLWWNFAKLSQDTSATLHGEVNGNGDEDLWQACQQLVTDSLDCQRLKTL